jgi:hypothetical protein
MRPTIDAGTDIFLTDVYVGAGETEPTPVPTDELVYNENVEWAVTASGVVVDPDDTTEHYQGSKSIEVGSIGNYDYIQFKAGSGATFNVEDWENIIANLKLKANLDTRKSRLAVVFLLDDVAINNPTNFDITGNTTNWQNLVLPFSRINFFGTEFNQIRFYFYKTTGGAITGFYLDYIKLEIGIEQPVLNQSVILTGDVIGSGVTGVPIPTALKVVNANIGTYGDGTHVARITVDAKGRVTAVEEVVIPIPEPGTVVIIDSNGDLILNPGESNEEKYEPPPGITSVETADSVVGDGSASNPVTLDGDAEIPGNDKYYGTDGTGTKGFHPLPEPGGGAFTIVNESSGSFTASATHKGNYTRVNWGNGVNVTMPADTFSPGDTFCFEQTGNGAITVVASGTTLNGYDGLTSYGQYAVLTVICISTNVFTVIAGTGF